MEKDFSKGPKLWKKILIGAGIIVLIAAIAVGGYFFFCSSEADETAETAITPTVSPSPSATVAASPSDCSATLSDADRTELADWQTYTSPTRGYTFKYPDGWTILDSNADNITVRGTDSGSTISFQVRSGEMSAIGFAEYTLTDTRSVFIDCVSATQSTYDGGENLTLIADSLTKIGTPFVFLFSYTDIGASFSSDMVYMQSLILKTFIFS